MTISEMQRHISDTLSPLVGEREARWTARIVMEHVTRKSQVDLIVYGDRELSDYAADKALAILARLQAGEPVQYILGEAPFHGYVFKVNTSTLIPRPETAELVDIIIDDAGHKPDLRVLDLGTGSGCIAVSLALNLKFAKAEGVDISPEAVAVARENASALKARVSFSVDDILSLDAHASSCYDIIVSNPPYIAESEKAGMERNVLDHEPQRALFVPDSDPLLFYRAITNYAAEALAPGGRLYFEINPLFAEAMKQLVANVGFSDIDLRRDSQGRLRFLSATRP